MRFDPNFQTSGAAGMNADDTRQNVWTPINNWLPRLERDDRQKLAARIRQDATGGPDFYIMMVLAATLASLGLLQGSTAVVIGAMLVAPLVGPLLGTALACAGPGQHPADAPVTDRRVAGHRAGLLDFVDLRRVEPRFRADARSRGAGPTRPVRPVHRLCNRAWSPATRKLGAACRIRWPAWPSPPPCCRRWPSSVLRR